MKTIYSDKIGRNIHSPFVYRLVVHGLCAPYPFYTFSEIEKWGAGKKETEKLKMMFRLINFFTFDELHFIGKNTEAYTLTGKLARPDLKIRQSEKYHPVWGSVSSKGYQKLVIFDSVNDDISDYPIHPEVWVLADLKKKDLQKLFSGLKFVDEARVFIEINRMGIVIFNRIFEKQDYVIKP